MSIVVYWLTAGQPSVQFFKDDELLPALAFAESKRKEKDAQGQPLHQHVVMNSELGDCVSKPGVSDELPADYSWSKSHRGGPPQPAGTPKTLG
ncbi:MAG TPA: hypothetical protein VFM48_00705 [Aquabacterium sp.]|nr:hypothetical protein [Aquabacterium sp.]